MESDFSAKSSEYKAKIEQETRVADGLRGQYKKLRGGYNKWFPRLARVGFEKAKLMERAANIHNEISQNAATLQARKTARVTRASSSIL